MSEDFNGFDEIHGVTDPSLNQKEVDNEKLKWERVDHLFHKVFVQNDDGKELLEHFKEAIMMTPAVTANATQFQAGIEEGKKEFVRQIILTIKRVEADT